MYIKIILFSIATTLFLSSCEQDYHTCTCTYSVDENSGIYRIITQDPMSVRKAKKYCESQQESLDNGVFVKETTCVIDEY